MLYNLYKNLFSEKAREQLKQVKKIHERGFTIRNALSKEGVKVLEEKRIKLSEQKKELDELLPLKSELESTKNEAEKFEKEAKDVFDTAWNGVVVNSKHSTL